MFRVWCAPIASAPPTTAPSAICFLPKLISGKIDLSSAERVMEAAE
jgi:hypothetical protein